MSQSRTALDWKLNSYKQMLVSYPQRKQSAIQSLLKLRRSVACLPKGSKRYYEHLNSLKKIESMIQDMDSEESSIREMIHVLEEQKRRCS
ncbi:hypothetical protein TRVA0_005S03818 [Trichomonascus vanleenenianus]|uniref:uncharacterized protein n=1 Tax=Trichomonascus vanleenenianus TaxID=2268995 RepID=UPI003ECA6EF7